MCVARRSAGCRYQDNKQLAQSLEKLRRFQMLCKARGQPTLLASVLRSAEGPQWRVRRAGMCSLTCKLGGCIGPFPSERDWPAVDVNPGPMCCSLGQRVLAEASLAGGAQAW